MPGKPVTLSQRYQRLFVKRPCGHPLLLARLKAREIAAQTARREWWKRAKARSALLMTLPRNGAIAEIGVQRGLFSALLKETLDPRELYLIDPWADAPDLHERVEGLFAGDPAVRIFRARSLEIAPQFADGSLDAVYIDGSHRYEDVRDDLAAWWPKVKAGGLLSGDDFYWSEDGGKTFPVRRAVREFLAQNRTGRWAAFRSQFIIERPE